MGTPTAAWNPNQMKSTAEVSKAGVYGLRSAEGQAVEPRPVPRKGVVAHRSSESVAAVLQDRHVVPERTASLHPIHRLLGHVARRIPRVRDGADPGIRPRNVVHRVELQDGGRVPQPRASCAFAFGSDRAGRPVRVRPRPRGSVERPVLNQVRLIPEEPHPRSHRCVVRRGFGGEELRIARVVPRSVGLRQGRGSRGEGDAGGIIVRGRVEVPRLPVHSAALVRRKRIRPPQVSDLERERQGEERNAGSSGGDVHSCCLGPPRTEPMPPAT